MGQTRWQQRGRLKRDMGAGGQGVAQPGADGGL